MPVLTPLTEGAETLSAVSEGSETLTSVSEGSETLQALLELVPLPALYPSLDTFPSAETFPSGGVGLLLALLSSDTQTLTPLTED